MKLCKKRVQCVRTYFEKTKLLQSLNRSFKLVMALFDDLYRIDVRDKSL